MSKPSSSVGGMRRKPRQARSQERVNRILDVAEDLFASQGYAVTTTSAIAAQAQVPIGTLYQFFPDKEAIIQALARRYAERLHQELILINQDEEVILPLADYVNQLIDTTDRFFAENPSYYAIFMEVQGTIRELDEIDQATDAKLIEDLASSFANRDARLNPEDYEAIAFVLVKAIGTLLWLSLSQEPLYRRRLVAETKRLTFHYLHSYFSTDLSSFD
ncbi:MAG: TetR/AcrR family transcriptional regulator [Leptolyngbyaceae cyanobacterium]